MQFVKVFFQFKKWVRAFLPTFLFFSLCFSACEAATDQAAKTQADKSPAVTTANPTDKKSFYRWLATEMHEQIYMRASANKNEVESWANVFSQGGSIEGVYHGMVLSTDYAKSENGRADLKVLRFFSQEMALLDNPGAKDSDPKVKASAEKYAKENMQTSLFTQKRMLGERFLAEIEKRKSDRAKLAEWYAGYASRWAKLGIDFGMKQRNDSSADFHKNWANENSLGLVQWELLNRMHRILNEYSGVVISRPDK